jgi:cobalt-zinc-cadmium efflux system protein
MAHAHHDHHGHDHHGHSHAPKDFGRAFAIGAGLNIAFVAAEAVAGLMTGSLALLADAGHNLSDVLGLLMAWAAVIMARRAPTGRRTYGLGKGTILASLANAGLLLLAVGAIVWEAIRRFGAPQDIAPGPVIIVAAIGVAINTATALMFMRGHGDLNVRGAFLHMAADAAVSLGVVAAALVLMAKPEWRWIDPVISLVIDPDVVRAWLAARPGVTGVHDLHIWAMSTTQTALTAHLVRPDTAGQDQFLDSVCHDLSHEFGIGHATLQLETGETGRACRLVAAHG